MVVLLLGVALLGALVSGIGGAWLGGTGAEMSRGRRLAGARGLAVADAWDLAAPPPRPVRVQGRVRCPDPLVTPDGDQLVAYHRDVEVRLPNGRWRTIERIREGRAFELWDHGGGLRIDPADIAEPIVGIPLIWEGSPDELAAPQAAAVARLAAEGIAATAARAVTRTIAVVDTLQVLADIGLAEAGPTLVPPPGGFVVSTLELDAAMRLLGGPRRRQLPYALGLVAVGAVLLAIGLLGAVIAMLVGA